MFVGKIEDGMFVGTWRNDLSTIQEQQTKRHTTRATKHSILHGA